MKNIHFITSRKSESKNGDNGYKIIKLNVSDPAENIYAVVTPVKKQ